VGLLTQASHLKRFKDVALLLTKYGRGDLVKGAPIVDDRLEHYTAPPVPPQAAELANDIEKLGPTFIKLGQLLSTRADFIPPRYTEALSRLQDNVQPFAYDEVEAIVAVELGARVSKAFSEFERQPLAAASLGQVHRAALRDGRPVAVKVQRPGIREKMAEDLDAMQEIAEFFDAHTDVGRRYNFTMMIEELRKSLMRELDYRIEAGNLHTFRARLRKFERIIIPEPVDDYSTGRVLTMDYIAGRKITKLGPLARLEFDGAELADELFQAYLQQILVDGVFHADPHPGNVFLTEDRRIALIDLGMVGRLGPRMQEQLLRLLLALSEGRSDDAAESAMRMGEPREDFDELQFRRRMGDLVGQQQQATLDQIQVGRVVLEVNQIAAETGIRVPSELTMLGKTLLNLDLVGRSLDRSFDPNESIRRNAADILQKRMVRDLSPNTFFATLLDAKEFIERLPARMNQVLDLIAANKIRVKVDAIDELALITGLQKIANRITLGLVLAALIVAAALMMRVETKFRLFGYPGFAMLFFLAATGGVVALVVSILSSDRREKK
jgi:predicted unusual protein kinase regulating ubiquinone biosynthesis (AarF/ABC1/UbiB family)